jgi:uncharacterized protein YbjT (DUF2867 family)
MDSTFETHRGRTALVVGATGAIGSELLQALLASEHYGQIHCVGRRLPQIEHEGLEGHLVDFEQLQDFSPEGAIDDVFCALGTTLQAAGSAGAFRRVDFDYVLKVGALAQRVGARTLSVVSSIGADSAAGSLYLQTKGELEAALIALELPTLHIFRPSLLADSLKRADFRLKEVLSNGALAILGPLVLHGRWRKYRRIAPARVARAMIQAVFDGQGGTLIYESDAIFDLSISASKPLV